MGLIEKGGGVWIQGARVIGPGRGRIRGRDLRAANGVGSGRLFVERGGVNSKHIQETKSYTQPNEGAY